jgi:hypothetical protein
VNRENFGPTEFSRQSPARTRSFVHAITHNSWSAQHQFILRAMSASGSDDGDDLEMADLYHKEDGSELSEEHNVHASMKVPGKSVSSQ